MNLITIDSTEVLIAKINSAHKEAQQYAAKAVERALEAGDLLLLAKSQVAHGQWLPWLQKNCPDISERTAQNYMKVAKGLPIEKRNAADLTMREALRLVAGELPALEHQPEILAPWWETKTPELNAAYCADEDSLRSACVWMDIEGKSIDDIAECLGIEPKYIYATLDPKIPDIYKGFNEVENKEYQSELNSLWNSIIENTNNYISYHQMRSYIDAARLAKHCNNDNMEKQLLHISNMHKRRFERSKHVDDEFVIFVATRLFRSAVYLAPILPACWLELGAAANLLNKVPNFLIQFDKATQVWTHYIIDTYDKANLLAA